MKRKLKGLYASDYEAQHKKVKTPLKDKTDISEAAESYLDFNNLHPYASRGWRTGNKVSHAASKTKGEKVSMKLRNGKRVGSVTQSQKLLDLGGMNAFNDQDAAIDYAKHSLRHFFGNDKASERFLRKSGYDPDTMKKVKK